MNTKTKADIRRFDSLGHADHGWLDARHHFSFASYHDPDRMGWGAIRVWNDDRIAAQSGFPPHPHADMEIITYVRSGAISHKDSLGNEGRTVAGDVQVMSAGTGIRHAEYNLEDVETSLFQIWIIPDRTGGSPSWGTMRFPELASGEGFRVLASGKADDGDALPIRADARVLGARLSAGETVDIDIAEGRHAYLVPATGSVRLDGEIAGTRDGVALSGGQYRIEAIEDAELVLVDAR